MSRRLSSITILLLLLTACGLDKNSTSNSNPSLFTLLPAAETGIAFRNDLPYDDNMNVLRYRNFYNGGGVAIGDINNDGLPDIFFTANMGPNKLYLNLGNLKFRDISEQAGVAGNHSWSTGVAMADVNGDGWLDIYVCHAGNPRPGNPNDSTFSRKNQLFINTGSGANGTLPTFTDKAPEYGIADSGLGTHAAFFDYDRDGDLDLYVLNNSSRPISSFDLRRNLRFTRDSLGGHKLYRNETINNRKPSPTGSKTGPPENGLTPEQPVFRDVSAQAGILGSVIAFGLGVTVGDADMDGWPDIYVSNDFFERDYLYHNNGNQEGRQNFVTFSEQLEKSMRHISASSMGADMADLNNDAYPEIFVTDMLPEPDYRIKTTTSFDGPDRFLFTQKQGYYNQFPRNMLHLNNADNTFSDIACLAGVEATDWSWGALMFDMDNDGRKDIFVANGIARDLTNQDFLSYAADPMTQNAVIQHGKVDIKTLIDSIPSQKISNYAFQNQGNLTFTNLASTWGLDTPSFSNGAAYADLDNDGDLDLVVNNVNMEAFVYRNNADKTPQKSHFLKFELHGSDLNTAALGAKIFLRAKGNTFYQEQMPIRGFQSSTDPRPNFGLGELAQIDTVIVAWPTGNKFTLLTDVPTNQILKLSQADANHRQFEIHWLKPGHSPLFAPALHNAGIEWSHEESNFLDWDRDRLLFFLYSTEGPRAAVGDVNGDGREDIFLCGATGQAGVILAQNPAGAFSPIPQAALQSDAVCEDVDAVFFDADGDGDQDLYVASGSNEAEPLSPALSDRIYLNNGHGEFTRNPDALPGRKPFASACVRAADYDGDGDIDLFVGMRLRPGMVGVPMGGYLLENDGTGHFSMQQPPAFQNLGMITDAVWSDIDGDHDPDLMIVGEWMAPALLRNDPAPSGAGRRFVNISAQAGISTLTGLWMRTATGDFNGDGRPDFLLGNTGLNTRLKTSPGRPLSLYFNDFDKNGTPEQILCRYNSNMLLPYVLRNDLVGNLPVLKKKYLHYSQYVNQKMTDIFSSDQMENTIELKAEVLASGILLSSANGTYQFESLPREAQFAPIYGIAAGDIDGDGLMDAVTGGNFCGAKPEFGYVDADYGLVLKGDGRGHFQAIRSRDSGLQMNGEIRDLKFIDIDGAHCLLAAGNNAVPEVFRVKNARNKQLTQ